MLTETQTDIDKRKCCIGSLCDVLGWTVRSQLDSVPESNYDPVLSLGISAENQARWRAKSERSAPAVCRCVEMMGEVQYSSARHFCALASRMERTV